MSDVDRQSPEPENRATGLGPLARLMAILGFISLVVVILVIIAPFGQWLPSATSQAHEVDNLFKFLLAASAVIFIYVQGLLLAFALRYRRQKRDPDTAIGPAVHGNTPLEIAWSAGPSLLVLVVAILSLKVWLDERPNVKNQLFLNVRAYQYGYAFSLPQYGVKDAPNVTLPINQPVYVTETSSDVIHAFWVPAFRIQYDAVPGIITREQFTPTLKGSFPVVCTQYCGAGHGGMSLNTKVTVGSAADFVSWLRKHGARTLPSSTTAALVQR